jgi:hypothetical protein
MAEYLILIYGDESALANATAEVSDKMMKGHQEFGERNAKALRGGNALQPTSTATSVRPDSSGSFAVTDGAFAETKEALGGATTSLKPLTWTRPLPWPSRSRCRQVGSRSDRSGPSTERRPATRDRLR